MLFLDTEELFFFQTVYVTFSRFTYPLINYPNIWVESGGSSLRGNLTLKYRPTDRSLVKDRVSSFESQPEKTRSLWDIGKCGEGIKVLEPFMFKEGIKGRDGGRGSRGSDGNLFSRLSCLSQRRTPGCL